MNFGVRQSAWVAAAVATSVALLSSASAETIQSALIKAYQNNPTLNAQRAAVRATDENVPQALSGYRPRVSITGTFGEQYTSQTTKSTVGNTPIYNTSTGTTTPYSIGVTANQTLLNGFQTGNRTRQAEHQVSAAREGLRVIEQTILLNGATSYMDVLRDTANLEVQRSNVRVLEETLRQTRDRFNVGEVTRTDVAQAEAQLASGQSALLAAQSTLITSRATYRQVIGVEPVNLAPGSPLDRYAPRTLGASIDRALTENPNVTAAMYGI
ncbi:MAG TPA: TolC family protein, partial [Xanthobacteraceae bacterium]|nr:TolC family protein [Xanthobacteraceae bacterium]